MNPAFVHLHVHTEFSLLDGMCRLERHYCPRLALMGWARELGQMAVAMTDNGNLFGAVHFCKAARKHGIKPILGCEIQMALGQRRDARAPNGRGENSLVLLAENDRGFANLMRLVSMAHLDCYPDKPCIDWGLLAAYNEGLIALSGGLKSEISQALIRGEEERARQIAAMYAGIMGKDRFYLELQDHGLPAQRIANRGLARLAHELGLPMVATNDVHYLQAEHANSHEMLLCLQAQAKGSDADRPKHGSDQCFLKSDAEMRQLFGELPEAIDNTWKIAERCNFELALGHPEGSLLPKYPCPNGLTHQQYLRQIAEEGVRRLYGLEDLDHPKDEREKAIAIRLAVESGTIEKAGFANYFLVVWDYVRAAKDLGIPVGPGRGAVVGSLVAYAIGITGVDPLRYGLIFERFLNPERMSHPDIDIDVCSRRRGEVIEYVKRKYGSDRVAQIVTFGEFGATTPVRQTERALDGLPTVAGTHAAGLVLGDRPLIESIPLTRNKAGLVVSQWDSDSLESMGLLKMDIIGLKTLTLVRETCDIVKRTKGIGIDPENLPLDDPKTYEMLARGDTEGVFQLDPVRMRHYLRQLQADNIEEIVALIELFRPWMVKTIPKYIALKLGLTKVKHLHPLLEGILRETHGVMVYQEQLQQAVGVMAGFSMGQGDICRRALGKKKPREVAAQRHAFIGGCVKRKTCSLAKAGQIFDRFAAIACYLFNKSHAVAYGLLTYQTAYLKANHPAEFMEAIRSSGTDGDNWWRDPL